MTFQEERPLHYQKDWKVPGRLDHDELSKFEVGKEAAGKLIYFSFFIFVKNSLKDLST